VVVRGVVCREVAEVVRRRFWLPRHHTENKEKHTYNPSNK